MRRKDKVSGILRKRRIRKMLRKRVRIIVIPEYLTLLHDSLDLKES